MNSLLIGRVGYPKGTQPWAGAWVMLLDASLLVTSFAVVVGGAIPSGNVAARVTLEHREPMTMDHAAMIIGMLD